jgi:enolase
VIEKIRAKKVVLLETPTVQSLKLQVWLNYQGRTEMRYEHILTYDQDEHEKQFIYDNKTERTGLDTAIKIINNDLSKVVNGTVVDGLTALDQKLSDYFSKCNPDDIGSNVTKIISEGVLFAAAACFEKARIFKGICKNVFKGEFTNGKRMTKLLINLLNGGKILGSAVKFAKFYLIIDGAEVGDTDIGECFIKFMQNLRKAVQSTKSGEAAFKPGVEGSYFNAFANINETFKAIEDAITASGANSEGNKPFKIGINCEGESYFNKDPKDPNKYEVEGAKNQHDQD